MKKLLVSVLLGTMVVGNMAFGMDSLQRKYTRQLQEFQTGRGWFEDEKTHKAEEMYSELNQRDLLRKQPPVKLEHSVERDNINKRTLLWNNANKISYIYLFQQNTIIGFYSIKGKVSSVNSQISIPQQIVRAGSSSVALAVIDSPAEDGSYGSNGDGVFFFTTDGAYVEWNGTYLLTDKPMKLNVEPMITNVEIVK